MENKIDPEILKIIVCPNCLEKIDLAASKIFCGGCGSEYKMLNGQADLRLVKEKKYELLILGLGKQLETGKTKFGTLLKNPAPEVNYHGVDVPFHLSPELISYFPKGNGGIALDLGCGTALHKEMCLHAGFKYLGLDYNSAQATIKGDAHALPLKDNSVDFIISIAVLEHVQHPYIMLREAYRVLKPGGMLIGTVSFLEPFHEISYYHHTYMGVFNSLNVAGFKVSDISPSPNWPAIKAISYMALFPRMPQAMISLLYFPLQLLHRLWWKLGRMFKKGEGSSENNRLLIAAGSFSFIAKKE